MAEITFGLHKTYDWSSGYWSTRTNGFVVNKTSPTAYNGELILAHVTPYAQKDWTDLDGWTPTGNVEIDPAGQLHGFSINTTSAFNVKTDFGDGTVDTVGVSELVKFDGLSTQTATNTRYGSVRTIGLATKGFIPTVRSDGDYFDWYHGTSTSSFTLKESTIPVDVSWHQVEYYTDGTYVTAVFDGDEVYTDGGLGSTSGAGRYQHYWKGSATVETIEDHITNTKWFSTLNRYASSLTYETDATVAIFDAGSGNGWKVATWTATTANGTAITIKYRTATTSAGLSSATYQTATSGVDFASGDKKRYIQIKIEGATAGSGRYTPKLTDLTLANETVASVAGLFNNVGSVLSRHK